MQRRYPSLLVEHIGTDWFEGGFHSSVRLFHGISAKFGIKIKIRQSGVLYDVLVCTDFSAACSCLGARRPEQFEEGEQGSFPYAPEKSKKEISEEIVKLIIGRLIFASNKLAKFAQDALLGR